MKILVVCFWNMESNTSSYVQKGSKSKKRKISKNLKLRASVQMSTDVHSGDTKISTISIAIPGSILDNAQSPEFRSYLASQIARSACIYQIDEIVVFDDNTNSDFLSKSKVSNSTIQLGRLLQYLECPQYLRKFVFPIHDDLKFAGLMNPLDAPHHLRTHNDFNFR